MTWLGGGLMVYSGTWGIGQSGSHLSSTLCSDAFILLIVNELLNFFLSCKELVHRQKKRMEKGRGGSSSSSSVRDVCQHPRTSIFILYFSWWERCQTFLPGKDLFIPHYRYIFSAILQLQNPPRFFYLNLPSWTLHHWAVPGQANNHFLSSQTVRINLNSPQNLSVCRARCDAYIGPPTHKSPITNPSS